MAKVGGGELAVQVTTSGLGCPWGLHIPHGDLLELP